MRSHHSGADGVVGIGEVFKNAFLEGVPFSTTPSAPLKEASRLLLDVASTPPVSGGEWRAPIHSHKLQALHQLFGLSEELLVGSLEVLQAVVLEIPDSSGHFIDHIVIVSYEEQGARITLKRDIEGVDRFQIEMVGWFVQYQEVGLLQHQPAENDSRRFAAGEGLRRFERILAAEEHLAEQSSQFLLRRTWIEAMEPFDDADAGWDRVPMILLEVSDADFMAPGHLPGIDRKRLIPSIDETGRISNQRFQKRGFAGAISSDQSDLLSAANG